MNNRRRFKRLVGAFIATAMLSTPVSAFASEMEFITNDRVNFRSEASMEADIYETLNYGTLIELVEYDGEGWSRVIYDGLEGFIKSEFLMEKPEYNGEEIDPSGIELLPWSEVKEVFTTHTPAHVYDVRSGLSYYVQSFSNGLHADVETLTQEDTNTLLQTYGGTWQWDPCPVWVTINGRTIAGSINGMPHGGGTISGNGMNGQVCIHFQGSTTHNGNTAFARDHQDAVMEAWNAR